MNVTVSSPPNVPPTVSLSAPATATVGVPITLNATAADSDGTIAKVEFYAGSTLVATDTTSPYSASWTGATAGTYSLTARATDNSGATTTSSAVSVTVSPPKNVPPTVTLSAPATATVGVPITLSATAADSDGTIAKVEFYAGSTLVATDTTSPYSASWTGSTAGTYALTARATDNSGATTTSSAVSVTVSAAATTGTAALSWGAVTEVPISGYRVYFGTSPRTYAQALGAGIWAGNVLSYTASGLKTGVTYYFAVTSVDSNGVESTYSSEASKLIP